MLPGPVEDKRVLLYFDTQAQPASSVLVFTFDTPRFFPHARQVAKAAHPLATEHAWAAHTARRHPAGEPAIQPWLPGFFVYEYRFTCGQSRELLIGGGYANLK